MTKLKRRIMRASTTNIVNKLGEVHKPHTPQKQSHLFRKNFESNACATTIILQLFNLCVGIFHTNKFFSQTFISATKSISIDPSANKLLIMDNRTLLGTAIETVQINKISPFLFQTKYTFRLSPPPRSITFLYHLKRLMAMLRDDRQSSSDDA